MEELLQTLSKELAGELLYDDLIKALYSVDASAYRELPLAVAFPKNNEDVVKLINFAFKNKVSIIPRAAGTSLAGQVVGNGIVVDVSKYLNKLIELNVSERWVKVQPGVIQDELNHHLKDSGLFFGPNTSTANRCMIGGMVGNNSCGSSSIVYGSTRDHVLEIEAILADGSTTIFKSLNSVEYKEKLSNNTYESKFYKQIDELFNNPKNKRSIANSLPKKSVTRRNTGYALDALSDLQPFNENGDAFNMCKLLTGSEGTLAFTTAVKLNLVPLPDPIEMIVAVHFESVRKSLEAVVDAMKFKPTGCELMDKKILDCTKPHIQFRKDRFFIEGDPGAILILEFRAKVETDLKNKINEVITSFQEKGHGFAYPIIEMPLTKRVWNLRKAGLGLLSNIPGDEKAVTCIEDTAVAIEDLPNYIEEFEEMMSRYGQETVYYAHAGAGELHLRPKLNLKTKKGIELFETITTETAKLVKKYRGSLSGEHGDGRLRAQFLEMQVGENNYHLFKEIKTLWDPTNIFNPGKIVNPKPMTEQLRYEGIQKAVDVDTIFSFQKEGGFLNAIENCTGSGDCRKLNFSGGTMCPSYRITFDEKDSTRGRANALREFLSRPKEIAKPFQQKELEEVMDLCLSCKGCLSECPSNVDMATLKAEYQYQKYKETKIPARAKFFGLSHKAYQKAQYFPRIANLLLHNTPYGKFLQSKYGLATQRSFPKIQKTSLKRWFKRNKKRLPINGYSKGTVYLFCDEFSNHLDVEIGKKAIKLLLHLGYDVQIPKHVASGRAAISKGLIDETKRLANRNIELLSEVVTTKTPLIGLEPSTILTFRDEYLRLAEGNNLQNATEIATNTFLIEEFIYNEIQKEKIKSSSFTNEKQVILLHGHCHQKALTHIEHAIAVLSLPENYHVELIPSGCCGMAGSFGYEKEHYEMSMKIGAEILFPAVKQSNETTIIATSGTSCRQQIEDGTYRKAQHPVSILYDALNDVYC